MTKSGQLAEWLDVDSPIAQTVQSAGDMAIAAYAEDPTLLREHVNIERATAEGGYERRQFVELVRKRCGRAPCGS